jgi:predicted ATP-grasp superfamily ATP-dependent carboligase
VIVQEWIEGSNDSIYFSLCCLGNPKPVAFTGRKGRSWPPQIGFTASCWAAPEAAEELEDITIRFFNQVGVTAGLASMEFKQDTRDGRFLMIEPTVARADRQVEISTFCGVNLCHVAYCNAAGLPHPLLHYDPRHVWRDEFTDFIAAWTLGIRCSYPPGHEIHNAHWRWDDPAPALMVAAAYTRKALRQVTGKRRNAPDLAST